jgi:predicted porin
MQKKIIALAVAALASTAAFAQSNVTIYGVADAYLSHFSASGQKGLNGVNSGGLAGSRIGFKGVEDLGNGLKALFVLEYAVAVDQNTPVGYKDAPYSSTAARQQMVGLTGGFGTAVAGRLQTAGYDWACAYNPVAGAVFDAQANVKTSTLLSCGSGGRANNAVAYISPSFGGVTVALNHAFVTENTYTTAASATAKNAAANLVSVSYANGPIAAGAIYSRIDGAGNLVASTNTAGSRLTEMGLGASYDLQVAKLYANYQTAKANTLTAPTNNRNNKFQLAVAVPVFGAGNVIAQFAKNNIKTTAADDNTKAYTLAYTHALSKRTTAYAGYTHLSNGGDTTTGATLGLGSELPTASGNASGVIVGMNHKF